MLRTILILALLETIVYGLPSGVHQLGGSDSEQENLSSPLAAIDSGSTENQRVYRYFKRSGLLNRVTDIMAAQRPRARGGPFWNSRPSDALTELQELVKEPEDYQEPELLPAVQLSLASRKAKICYMNPVSCFGRRMRSSI